MLGAVALYFSVHLQCTLVCCCLIKEWAGLGGVEWSGGTIDQYISESNQALILFSTFWSLNRDHANLKEQKVS